MLSQSLEAERVSKSFPSRDGKKSFRSVLSGISFAVAKGETFGIMGASGSGKTTLAKILGGLEPLDSGCVLYARNDIRSMSRQDFGCYRRNVQIVFQNPESAFNPRKTLGRSLSEVLRRRHHPEDQSDSRQNATLESVGLSAELLSRKPRQISGGQNQRMALARVLLLDPEFIILDEPTSALDASAKAQLLHLLRTLQKERAIGYVLISHDRDVIRFMAHRKAVLENGQLTDFSP